MRKLIVLSLCLIMSMILASCATLSGRPSAGSKAELDEEAQSKLKAIGAKVQARVVWSSSRAGNHDLFVANADGTDFKALTKSEQVDWFPRFSRDGKRIMFTRSKKGFVFERDANFNQKWDLFTIAADGSNPTKIAENASWGTWIGENEILFARKTKVFKKELGSGDETLLVDSQTVESLGGADLQQPQLSPDRKFLAITLRGSRRETGILDLDKKTWVKTGEGCQINWHPTKARIYWINPSGTGGSEVFSVEVADGKPIKDFSYEEMQFIDIPGRISHEYFPQMSHNAKWLVWGATRRGHDHDIADYEIHIWEIGTGADQITRLSFHSGNDRWPDIHLKGAP